MEAPDRSKPVRLCHLEPHVKDTKDEMHRAPTKVAGNAPNRVDNDDFISIYFEKTKNSFDTAQSSSTVAVCSLDKSNELAKTMRVHSAPATSMDIWDRTECNVSGVYVALQICNRCIEKHSPGGQAAWPSNCERVITRRLM
jgi:hypothetical protein